MALKRKSIPSPNYSSRGGATVRLIVVHTAEGATTIESLGSFFASPSSGVSSQVGIDDKAGVVGEYVKRGSKSWTQAEFNPVATSAELCGFAKWGSSGGGHSDPGSGFPWSDVIAAAKNYAAGKGGGGSADYMNPPGWLWPWLSWYLTTSRDPKKRPGGAPDKIPQWAWDYQAEVQKIGKRYGMTAGERDWIGWRAAGSPPNKRPDVPDTIPERWWPDNEYVVEASK